MYYESFIVNIKKIMFKLPFSSMPTYQREQFPLEVNM